MDPSVASFRSPHRQGDIDLIPSRRLPAAVPRSLRLLVEEDEDYWADGRFKLLGSTSVSHPSEVLPDGYKPEGLACLVNAAVFPPQNVRSYLCLYQTVFLVCPLASSLESNCKALGVTPKELQELVELGRLRLVLPQAVDRYDLGWLAGVADTAPKHLLLSRRLAAATVADTRRRWPIFYPPIGISERRGLLEALTKAANSQPEGEVRQWLLVVRDTLISSWTSAESQLHHRGAMGTALCGVPELVGRLFESARGKNLHLEFWSAGAGVEWASALGANLFPIATGGYSEERASEIIASLYGSLGHERVPTIGAGVHAALDGILTLDNDIPVIDFAKEFGSGDITRLRELVLKMASESLDQDYLEAAINGFNAEVRRVESRPERLRSLNIISFVAAVLLASLPTDGSVTTELRRFLPIGAWLMNLLVVAAGEEFAAKNPHVGAVLDFINGRLAGQRPEAVLVSRVRKQVKILKG